MKHDPKTGQFTGPSKTIQDRFWPKVHKTKTCWLWQAASTPLGYGVFWNGKKLVYAHRFCYELLTEKIPDKYDLDHLCRNPSCINPAHLEPVPHRVNSQRGETGKISGRKQAAKTHCPKGHPYNKENTYINPTTKARHCRTCRKYWDQASRKKKRGKLS